jgi:adenylate cyclase
MDYVVVDERTVGRWHATIERRGQTFWIRDEGSVNGTFVNDQRITGEHPLKHGDMVRVHRHEFEFVIPELFDSDRTMIGNPTQMAAQGADASGAS